ncbi:MAG: glycosyl hydrolase 53 family protein [Chitinophagaceae bacterium]|nr:glycosyl hydrolase 53 family protein [Chitinophagaceae bacterium]
MKAALVVLISVLFIFCKSGKETVNPKLPAAKKYKWDEFCMGADLSYVNQILDKGGVYKDSGKIKDPYELFASYGTNTVRVRLWHSPTWQLPVTGGKLYSDLYDVEKTIRRSKAAGMAVSLDLHYSDDWADPQKQAPPAVWEDLSFELLKDSVYQYTLNVLKYLQSKNLVPEMIQIGNETNPGMLFPKGQIVNGNFKPFAELLKSGIKAVRDFSATSTIKPQIILHVAQLQDAGWWTKGVIGIEKVTDFDIIGLSHYSKWSKVNTMQGVTDTIRSLVTLYNKKVMVVETAYPWTGSNLDSYNNLFGTTDSVVGYPLSPEGQHAYMKDLVQAIISGGGTGIQYWEPAWITSPMRDRWGTGSSWENNALFGFYGNVLPAMNYMTADYKF